MNLRPERSVAQSKGKNYPTLRFDYGDILPPLSAK